MPWDDKIGLRLKLKDLLILRTVIDAGGIGKAAHRLNYSQPAVSKAIASLERIVGRRLFERGRRGIELTPYGSALLKCGVAVFDDLRNGINEIDAIADPTEGEVRITCSEPVSAGIVSAVVNKFVRQYPRVTFNIHAREPPLVYRDLDDRNVDFVITQTNTPIDEEHMQQEVLYDEPVVVVAGARHPLARKRRIKLSDLADAAWALPPRDSFISSVITGAFRANGLAAPRIVMRGSTQTRLTLLADGRLLTIVPATMLKVGASHAIIKVLPVELPGNRRPVSLVTLKNRALSPVAQLFIEHTRLLATTMARS